MNTSYLWGETQYGSKYHFTYYSEFGERGEATIIEVTILISMFIISVIINVGMAGCVLRYKEIQTPTNLCLVNLAMADLLFAFGVPAVAYTRLTQSWRLGDVVCALLPYSEYVCGFVLLWTLTIISIDRHRCLVVAPYRSILTNRRVLVVCFISWIVAALVFFPVTLWFKPRIVSGGVTICTLLFPQKQVVKVSLIFTIVSLTLTCLLPMVLLAYYHYQIFRKILNTRERWAVPCVAQGVDDGTTTGNRRDSELSVVGTLIPWIGKKFSTTSVIERSGRSGSMSQHEETRLYKHIRVMRILLLNVISVLLMWLPITIVALLIYIDGQRSRMRCDFFLRSHHFIWALIAALLNTIVNPILYGIFSESFKACAMKLLQFCIGRSVTQEEHSGSKKSTKSMEIRQDRPGGSRMHGSFKSIVKQTKSSTCSIRSIIEVPSSEII